nr:fumarylacetoacetate hydrolase family protein [Actinomadura sp. WMMB 499]
MTSPPAVQRFALGTFAHPSGSAFAGLLVDGRVLPLPDGGLLEGPITVRRLLEQWEETLPRLAALAEATGDADRLDLADLRVLPPVAPHHIIQAGANYRAHLLEMAAAQARGEGSDDATAWAAAQDQLKAFSEGRPFLFIGLPSAMCGPHDDILLPEGMTQPDWEAEIAVVIGRPARHVTPDQAMDHVAGYTVCNDISARDWQFPPSTAPWAGTGYEPRTSRHSCPPGPSSSPRSSCPTRPAYV